MLRKELKDTEGHRGNDTPYSWLGRISTVKITILIKSIYRFGAISIKLPIHRTRKFFLQICMETEKTPKLSNLEKEKWSWTDQVP